MGETLPEPVLKKLKCYICTDFLLCAPVRISKDGASCGNCLSDGTRSSIYETFAERFKYPCRNKCPELIDFGDDTHRDRCIKPKKFSLFSKKLHAPVYKEIAPLLATESDEKAVTCNACKARLNPGPIFIQSSGNIVCANCKAGGDLRHAALEAILEHVKFTCKYTGNGCTAILTFGPGLGAHERKCQYMRASFNQDLPKRPRSLRQTLYCRYQDKGCLHECGTQIELFNHEKQCRFENLVFECEGCLKIFQKEKPFKEHVLNCKLMECENAPNGCEERFNCAGEVHAHLKSCAHGKSVEDEVVEEAAVEETEDTTEQDIEIETLINEDKQKEENALESQQQKPNETIEMQELRNNESETAKNDDPIKFDDEQISIS